MRPLGLGRCIDWAALEQHVMTTHDEPGTTTFLLNGLVRHLSVPEFGATLGLYTEDFMSVDNFFRLDQHIQYSPSSC
ncbi:hypothetical protein PVK06_021296 [Gossypium arboreum]|uniref:Uncharacterized protein n=1 Tax=Gossypium arboreum TaxID=29729 RepID=A0ABR0PPV0_GOSAR|nr:hypothetical protein PVK06_021296 [Gossypium arboreum]